MALIIFSHGNSFPAGTYSMLFRSLRARGFSVRAVEKFGHDPRYPVTSNWPHLVEQLADFSAPEASRHDGPLFLVGHSLGGFLSLMCAAKHPVLGGRPVQGVVMLDSPVMGGWRARTLALVKRTQLVGSLSPARVSRRRRIRWPDADTALEHFRHKRAFAHWHPQVLKDYITHGTHDDVDSHGKPCRTLSFDRDIESAIYNTLPHNVDRLLRKHPLQCPAAFIAGEQSWEMQRVGWHMTRKVVGPSHPERLRLLKGSHLFPMEQPEETAGELERLLRSFSDSSSAPVRAR